MNNSTTKSKIEPDSRWENSTLTQLVAHLLEHHHPYTRNALEELNPLIDKVLLVHGDAHPELQELHKLFTELRDDMATHLMKEEKILFPYMLALESESPPAAHFGTIANPIRMMTMEHQHDSQILKQMQNVTDNFTLPPGACNSFTLLYQGLDELVSDLFQHIHLENDIVFPMAVATEKNIQAKA
jgi:regulator of cell morphogenesis and NO signaling